MILRNIGTKIVNVGSVVLMPGDNQSFPKSMVDTPAIHTLCEKGFLKLEEEAEEKKAEKKPEDGGDEDPGKDETNAPEAPAKTEAPEKKKSGRTKKTAE